MFYKVLMFLITGLVPSIIFGYIVTRKFEKLSASQAVGYLRLRKLKTLFWSVVGLGWPVLVYYLLIDRPSFDLMEALLGFILGVCAMLAGGVWRRSERKEEQEKLLQSEGTGY